MGLNLNTIKHARLAAEMTQLQRQDAAIAISQGKTIRRLTFVNMVYLPPTSIAVDSMTILYEDCVATADRYSALLDSVRHERGSK